MTYYVPIAVIIPKITGGFLRVINHNRRGKRELLCVVNDVIYGAVGVIYGAVGVIYGAVGVICGRKENAFCDESGTAATGLAAAFGAGNARFEIETAFGNRSNRSGSGIRYTERGDLNFEQRNPFMAYNQFTMAKLRKEYHLNVAHRAALFADAPPAEVSDFLRETLRRNTALALRSGSEKARSEYIIAPILTEAYEQMEERVNLFSGVEFNVDKKRGLAGFCDFLFSLGPAALDIQAPVLSVVEAKKEDIPKGIPQCLAELVAAQIFNLAEERPIETLYGIVTTGTEWKFLRLRGTDAVIDADEYFLIQPEKIVGIILSMLNQTE